MLDKQVRNDIQSLPNSYYAILQCYSNYVNYVKNILIFLCFIVTDNFHVGYYCIQCISSDKPEKHYGGGRYRMVRNIRLYLVNSRHDWRIFGKKVKSYFVNLFSLNNTQNVLRRVWRYQRGNQNPYIEEQTTQWPKEKDRRTDNTMTKRKRTNGQTTIYKTYT